MSILLASRAPARLVSRMIAMAAVVAAAAGCAPVRVSTDYDPRADLGALRTYAWTTNPTDAERDPRLDNTLLDGRIRNAVDRELAARGIVPVTENPDFHLGYDIVLEKELRVASYGGWSYYGWGWGWAGYPRTYGRAYDRTVLILDFTDPTTGNLLWRGMARGNLIADATPEEREVQVGATIAAVLERFPPQPCAGLPASRVHQIPDARGVGIGSRAVQNQTVFNRSGNDMLSSTAPAGER